MTVLELMTLFARYINRINDIDVIQMCGLTIGTDPTTLQTQNQIVFQLYNQQITLNQTDNIPITSSEQAANTFCYYLVSINQFLTITVTKGTDNTYALPNAPIGNVPIGAFKVTTVGVTFTASVTPLNGTGITTLFYDIDCGIAMNMINQAMRKTERNFNFRPMKVRVSIPLGKGIEAIDNTITNYKELINAYAFVTDATSSRWRIQKQAIEYVEQVFQAGTQGPPQYIAEVPASEATLTPDMFPNLQWMVRPIPDVDYTLILTAYQFTPLLDGVIYLTNWWTQYQWDVILYGALVEASPYHKADERTAMWKQLHDDNLAKLVRSDRYEQFSGSIQYTYPDNIW